MFPCSISFFRFNHYSGGCKCKIQHFETLVESYNPGSETAYKASRIMEASSIWLYEPRFAPTFVAVGEPDFWLTYSIAVNLPLRIARTGCFARCQDIIRLMTSTSAASLQRRYGDSPRTRLAASGATSTMASSVLYHIFQLLRPFTPFSRVALSL